MSFNVTKNSSQFGSPKESSCDKILLAELPDMTENEDIIDINLISFDDDETWLFQSPKSSTKGACASIFTKHQSEISNDSYVGELTQDLCSKESSSKYINTQTFTRPKKKFTRPSIEKYNQELFDNNDLLNRLSSPEPLFNKTQSVENSQMKPLEFDLNEPTSTSFYFHKIAANVENEDNFQNESLPSLVNSMCSSTFTNLMESSFIKNDPVLKQICDTDFTSSILSQGSEPSSLLNSHYGTTDMDEFLTKVSQNDILKSMEIKDEMKCSGDASYIVYKKDILEEDKKTPHIMDFEEYHDATDTNFTEGQNQYQHNGTFKKNSKLSSATFRKTDYNRSFLKRNDTFEIDPKDVEKARNVTMSIESPKSSKPRILRGRNETIVKSSSMEDFKNTTILKDSCNNDLNRYASKESNLEIECITSKGGSKKSLECSIGSADSLDRMSTLSSSSRGSNKMLNMEEVEAIAEKQEQSLHVMSTPKPNWSNKMYNRVMWDHSIVSPIVTNDTQSDSGDSSDEYKSVKSSFSKNSVESNPVKQTRSLVSLQDPSDARKLKSINTMVNTNNLCKVPLRGSSSNLQKFAAPAPKLSCVRVPSAGSITSNLRTMKPSLKGSYTSLKPVNSYLPVAPPINAPSQGQNTTYLAPANAQNQEIKNTKGQLNETTVIKMSGDGVFVKPNGPLRSGLPRPTSSTSIPKPVSRIPGPRRFIPQKQDPSRKGF